jgi:hypothetical protein
MDATDHLLWDVYHYDAAARKRPRGWVDPPSASILQIYAIVYGYAAQAYAQQGDTVKAHRAEQVSEAVMAQMPRDGAE